MMFHRRMWTDFFYSTLDIRFYLSLSLNLTSNFANFADFRQLQIPNAQTRYHEILPPDSKSQHNTARYFELKCHFLTLQKLFRLPLNKGVSKCFALATTIDGI